MRRHKIRLDQLLVDRKMVISLELAQGEILAGNILVNDQKIDKCGHLVKADAIVRFIKEPFPYVSRGALKLEGAHREFDFPVQDEVVLDIGQSTGGFTDYALQNGAKFVFGVDVGYNQLDYKIRQHPHVCAIEHTNARNLTLADLQKAAANHPIATPFLSQISLVVMDVSFISVTKILPALKPLVQENTHFIILIKPQFEAKKEEVPKGGVIQDPVLRDIILNRVLNELKQDWHIQATCPSPIAGTKGNQEFWVWLKNQ